MEKYKIIVRGGYGLTNFGDDALLKCLHEDYFSSFSNSELAYSCTDSGYLKKYVSGYDILPLTDNYNNRCDVLVYGGGTQFYSFEKHNIQEKFNNNKELIKNPIKLFNKIIQVCKRQLKTKNNVNYKTAALGIGVGPFLKDSDPKVEEGVSKLFQGMGFVGVRDVYSEFKCKSWNVKNFKMYSDLCFKMNDPLFFQPNKANKINNLGIVVRDWKRTKEGGSYRNSLMNFVAKMTNSNVEVTFFVFAKTSDSEWINYLTENKINFILWNPDKNSFDYYLEQLNNMDAFVTARYHGAVFSSMLGKPFITIEVEQKLKMFSEIFKLGSKNWSHPFSEGDLFEKFSEINQNYTLFSNSVYVEAKNQKQLSESMAKDLLTFLNSNS